MMNSGAPRNRRSASIARCCNILYVDDFLFRRHTGDRNAVVESAMYLTSRPYSFFRVRSSARFPNAIGTIESRASDPLSERESKPLVHDVDPGPLLYSANTLARGGNLVTMPPACGDRTCRFPHSRAHSIVSLETRTLRHSATEYGSDSCVIEHHQLVSCSRSASYSGMRQRSAALLPCRKEVP